MREGLYTSGRKLSEALQKSLDEMATEVAAAGLNQLDDPDFRAKVVRSARFEPIHLDINGMEPNVKDLGHGRVQVTYVLPFSGSGSLLWGVPSTFPSVRPAGDFDRGTRWSESEVPNISFTVQSTADRPEEVRSWRDNFLKLLGEWVIYANNDARAHNDEVESRYEQAVHARRQTIQNVTDFKSQL